MKSPRQLPPEPPPTRAADENPFCTRRVRPGAIPFIFPAGENAQTFVDRLQKLDWRAAIVGPHGSGKSALLATLIPEIERRQQRAILVELHDQQRRLPLDLTGDPRLHPPAVLIIDGYEQLSRWSRLVLKRYCRRRGLGLLVTTHEPADFPELYRAVPTLDTAKRIVATLLGAGAPFFTAEELSTCFNRHGGNLRETLFELYDLYQQRRST